MTIAELIEKLKTMPQDYEVVIPGTDYEDYTIMSDAGSINVLDEQICKNNGLPMKSIYIGY